MKTIRAFLVRLAATLVKAREGDEIREELESHLAMQIDDNVRAGMTLAEARRDALLRAGGLESASEAVRDQRGLPLLETIAADLRHAQRTLRRAGGFTAVVVVTLAIGIGASTAIFSVVRAVVLRPLPYRDSGRLVMLWTDDPLHDVHEEGVSYPNFRDWRSMGHSFDDMAFLSRSHPVTATGRGEPERLVSAVVSANVFPLLGVAPAEGRGFSPEEAAGGERVVVLSHSLWLRRFGGAPTVIGQSIELDGAPWRVVGVMPASFQFPSPDTQLWEQLTAFNRWSSVQEDRYSDWGRVVARLRPDVTVAAAQAEMLAIGKRLERSYPPVPTEDFAGFGVNVIPLLVQVTGKDVPRTLWVLFGAVVCVLLIACANVASLTLARGSARAREIAVRHALGASRRRIVRQLLTESMLLAGAGGTLGLALAAAAIRLLVTIAPSNLPRADEIHIAPGVIGFAIGASLLAGMLSGLAPAVRISARGEMNRRDSTEGRESMRTRSALVIVECALSSALLCGAGLLIHSFLRVRAVDPGFRPEHVLTMRLAASGDDAANVRFYDQVLERVGSLPGVDRVGVIEDALQRRNPDYQITVAGRVSPWSEPLSGDAISPKALEALGVRLLTGRWFSDRDRGGPRVALINETMARHVWGSANPVGKHFREADARPGQPWDTVVGVVADMHRQGLERQPIAQIFWPHFARASETMDLVIRTTVNASELAPAVVRAIRATDPDAPVSSVATLEQRLDDSLSRRRWESSLLAALSTIALILAAIGIYGLVHFSVVQRTREIGVRMALGAQAEDVVAMVVRQGVVLALIGMGAGLVGIMAMTRALSALLFGVTSGDPATLIAVVAVNFVMTLAACAAPARKASRIDPLVAIRCE